MGYIERRVRKDNVRFGALGRPLNKYGISAIIGTATDPQDVWSFGGLYPYGTFATAQTLEILSDDTEDAVGGTGAQRVVINGLDGNGNITSRYVVPDGTTPVTIQGTWLAESRAYVSIAGSAGANVGNLTIRVSGGGTVISYIPATKGQTFNGVYRVPANYEMVVENIKVGFIGGPVGDAIIEPIAVREDCLGVRSRGTIFVGTAKPSEKLDFSVGGIELDPLEWLVIRVVSVTNNGTQIFTEFDAMRYDRGNPV